MDQLSPMDASFLYFETANAPMHIGGLTIYDQSTVEGGVLGFKRILENYETRLHLARSFRQRVVHVPMNLDHPYWIEDPNFDIEFHVRHIALPKPGNWRQLCIQVARLHARPLDISRPLWEFTVIEGLDQVEGLPPGSFGIMSKIHHAAIDGVSGAEIVAAIHDIAPDARPAPPEKPWVPERDPNVLELLSRTYINNLRQPFKRASWHRRCRLSRRSVLASQRASSKRRGPYRAHASMPASRRIASSTAGRSRSATFGR